MKKILALLLVMLMSMSVFVGCFGGKELTKEDLIGTWEMAVSLDNLVDSGIESATDDSEESQAKAALYKEMLDGIEMKFEVTFESDDTYSVKMTGADASALKDKMIENTIKYLSEGGIVDVFAMQGKNMSMTEIVAEVAKEGLSMDEFYDTIAESMSSGIDVSKLADAVLKEGGDYELASDTLSFGEINEEGVEEKFSYTYDGTTITLGEKVDGESHPFTGAVLTKK